MELDYDNGKDFVFWITFGTKSGDSVHKTTLLNMYLLLTPYMLDYIRFTAMKIIFIFVTAFMNQ